MKRNKLICAARGCEGCIVCNDRADVAAERERFKAWAKTKNMDLTPFGETFDSDFTSRAWDAWQARAAISSAVPDVGKGKSVISRPDWLRIFGTHFEVNSTWDDGTPRTVYCDGYSFDGFRREIESLYTSPQADRGKGKSVAGCNMGVGCDEAGVCYAIAHGQPDRCAAPQADHVDGGKGEAVADLLPDYIELNMSNYDEHDVSRLNEWAIRAYGALTAPQAVLLPDGSKGEAVYQLQQVNGAWRDVDEATYRAIGVKHARITYTAPQAECAPRALTDSDILETACLDDRLDGVSNDALLSFARAIEQAVNKGAPE